MLGPQTLEIIKNLQRDGIRKMAVIMRHSEKKFTTEPGMEPFMNLTDQGKEYAFDFGKNLDSNFSPKLYSSTFGRCVETAYLIDKGFTRRHGETLSHTVISRLLTPFYVNDIRKVSDQVDREGNDAFLSQWFDKKLPDTIIRDPQTTAAILSAFMLERVKELETNEIAICISHDWNLYPIKEFMLGLKFKNWGDVGYLEGIVYFKDNGSCYLTGYQKSPVEIDMDLIEEVSFSAMSSMV